MTRAATIAVLVASLPRPASAGDFERVGSAVRQVAIGLELLIPDVRYEWTDSDDAWVLAVPLVVSIAATDVSEALSEPDIDPAYAASVFVEPQLQLGDGDRDWRFLGGAKFGMLPAGLVGLYVEGAGVGGTDGGGGMAGAGVILGHMAFFSVQAGYRSTWAGGQRHDISLGVEIPLTVLVD